MTPEHAPSPGRAPIPGWLRYALAGLLCLLVAGLAWITWTQRSGLVLSALQRRIPLARPVSVTLDARGTLYTLDDKYFRILGIDASGRAVSQRYVRSNDSQHYEYWSELAVDSDGVLYATKVVYFVDTELVDYEEIDRYPPGGREEVLYTLDHEEDEYAYDTHLLTLQVHDGYLYFDVRREEAVELWRMRIGGDTPRHVLDIAVPSADVYNLAGYDETSLFVASYSGDQVFRLGPGGSLVDSGLHPARPEVPAYVLADKLFLDSDDRLLMSDLFNQCVYRAGKDGALEVLLSKDDLPRRPERALYKDIWVADDGRIAVVESIGGDAGRLVVFGPNGDAEREITEAVPSLCAVAAAAGALAGARRPDPGLRRHLGLRLPRRSQAARGARAEAHPGLRAARGAVHHVHREPHLPQDLREGRGGGPLPAGRPRAGGRALDRRGRGGPASGCPRISSAMTTTRSPRSSTPS